jgi:hypothetical protein
MKKALGPLTLLIAIALTTPILAEDSPAPRTPIGPQGRTTEMRTPSHELIPTTPQPLPNTIIRIQNVGDQRLFMSYWDPESSWRTVSVDAGQTSDLSCQKCGGQFTVAFHNGKSLRQIIVPSGNTYLLGWSDVSGVWELTSSR